MSISRCLSNWSGGMRSLFVSIISLTAPTTSLSKIASEPTRAMMRLPSHGFISPAGATVGCGGGRWSGGTHGDASGSAAAGPRRQDATRRPAASAGREPPAGSELSGDAGATGGIGV